jgi:hypothetical protein
MIIINTRILLLKNMKIAFVSQISVTIVKMKDTEMNTYNHLMNKVKNIKKIKKII